MLERLLVLVIFTLATQISFAGKTSDSVRVTARVLEVCEISSDSKKALSAVSSVDQSLANWSCSHQSRPALSLTDENYRRIEDDDFQANITSQHIQTEPFSLSNLPDASTFTLEF